MTPGRGGQQPAHTLVAGELEAVFLPGQGMLGASLTLAGEELLGRVDNLESSAAKGSTAGLPVLYPWANRLAAPGYRVAGREVTLDLRSALLHVDEHGLPIHGVPWARLPWQVTAATRGTLQAWLDWTEAAWLAVFPFRHRVELSVDLRPDGLLVETTGAGERRGRGACQLRLPPVLLAGRACPRPLATAASAHAPPGTGCARHPDGRGDALRRLGCGPL